MYKIYKTTVFQEIEHQAKKETDTEMRSSKLGEFYNCPSLQTKEFTGHKMGGQGTQGGRVVSLSWGDEAGSLGRHKVPRFAGQITRGEICTEKEHENLQDDPPHVFS